MNCRPVLLRLLSLCLALGAGFASTAQAQSLVELFNAAKGYDASYQSAQAQAQATVAKGEQARAGILPSVGLSAGLTHSSQDSSLAAQSGKSFNAQTASISATQPLYRPANLATYEQGQKQADIAAAQLLAAEQDLMVRLSQAYFDVLAASDSLTYVRRLKAATAEQLASAKRNFEVGTTTIVDTRDAQARFDLVLAQELAAENDVRIKSLALDQLVGKTGTTPKPLLAPVNLDAVQTGTPEQWVQQAQSQNPLVQQATIAVDIAKLETRKAQSANRPTVDLNGSYNTSSNSGSSTSNTSFSTSGTTLGLALNWPLFAGYSIQNRIRETVALENKAQSELAAAARNVAQSARTAFFGVQTALSQVKAYEAAEASSQSALEANQLGYQVGVKINIDVLNAQSQLYNTKASLSKARYEVLLGSLKLRQAAGVLSAADLQTINARLVP